MVKRKRKVQQTGRSNIKRDRKLRAKLPGKRRSKRGRTYYENRRNRSDKSRKLKL